jgi:hypothetical protein
LEHYLLLTFGRYSWGGLVGDDRNGEATNENTHSDGPFQRDCSSFLSPGPGGAADAGGLIAAASGRICRHKMPHS